MPMTASKLRADIYKLLDEVLATGEPLIIERNGRTLRVIADPPERDFDTLPSHPGTIIGDPNGLIHVDWSADWEPFV